MAKPVNILIADSHFLIRQGLRSIFDQHEEFIVSAEAEDYAAIIPIIEQKHPDVVVVGLNIHGVSATDAIDQILRRFPEIKVLVLDTNEDTNEIIKILKLGVHGYILKQCDQQEIIDAVISILAGKNFFCSNVIKLNKKGKGEGEPVQLSERELEILELISQGLTNKEIADKTFISSHTVASHRKNLMKKFQAKNNVDLVISAIRENFIAPK